MGERRGNLAAVWLVALLALVLAAGLPRTAEAQADAWYGEYFATVHLVGAPALTRNDANINFGWGEEAPDPRLPRDGFAVRWSRYVEFEAGTYLFYTTTDDGVRLYINDLPVINDWREHNESTRTATVRLTAGQHAVRMEMFDATGNATARLRWERAGAATEQATVTPAASPTAAAGSVVDTATPVRTATALATATPSPVPTATPQAPETPTAVTMSTATPASTSAAASSYIVQRGDSLPAIAARFSTTAEAIITANPNLRADRLFIGQRILIPATAGGTGTVTATSTPAGTGRPVQLFLVSEGTGNIGCGDEIVGVQREIPRTAGLLRGALDLLLSEKQERYGESGLYNALHQSDLRIERLSRRGNTWTVQLTGTLSVAGACDGPRIVEQLRQTAMQFATVTNVRFLVNGVELERALSEQ
jgi:LysM repeat protein